MNKLIIVLGITVLTGCAGNSELRKECEAVGGKFMQHKPVDYGQMRTISRRTTSCLYPKANGPISDNWE
tara:strand:- start:1835 stop:2041 length:207 start_codon:yes stop_codon:yes gene_type:complete